MLSNFMAKARLHSFTDRQARCVGTPTLFFTYRTLYSDYALAAYNNNKRSTPPKNASAVGVQQQKKKKHIVDNFPDSRGRHLCGQAAGSVVEQYFYFMIRTLTAYQFTSEITGRVRSGATFSAPLNEGPGHGG